MKPSRQAFTLVELLVVIAIIAVLAATLLPALASTQQKSQTNECLNNMKELNLAWLMYASENNDFCAGNWWQHEQDWKNHPQENWVSGWVDPTGSAPNGSATGTGEADSTNTDILVNPQYSTLGSYTENPGLFLCPACIVTVKAYPGQRLVRTVSMNCWVGYNTMGFGTASFVAKDPNYRIFNKTTAITGMSPSDLFVFTEERGESIDDGWFNIDSPRTGNNTVENMPADYHNGAAAIGFADGHVDLHIWGSVRNFQVSSGNPANANFNTPQQSICPKWADPIGNVSTVFGAPLFWQEQHATCPN